MKTISCREAKDNMAEVLNEVAYGHKRFKIARRKKDMAIIISVEEWEEIEKILQRLEDEEDIHEAKLALKEVKEKGTVSFDEMKKRAGI
jgi:prevent-host-death family protein